MRATLRRRVDGAHDRASAGTVTDRLAIRLDIDAAYGACDAAEATKTSPSLIRAHRRGTASELGTKVRYLARWREDLFTSHMEALFASILPENEVLPETAARPTP